MTSQNKLMRPGEVTSKWFSVNLILFRDGGKELVEKYIEKNYKKESSRVSLCFNQAGNLQIDISCINLRLKEFWTGEW